MSVLADVYHRVSFDDTEEAAAFVAALSRYLASPAGDACRSADSPIEIIAAHDVVPPAVGLYLSAGALRATAAGFGLPDMVDRCRPDELPMDRLVVLGDADRLAYGRDDIVKRLSS
jgi:hypothetical protein